MKLFSYPVFHANQPMNASTETRNPEQPLAESNRFRADPTSSNLGVLEGAIRALGDATSTSSSHNAVSIIILHLVEQPSMTQPQLNLTWPTYYSSYVLQGPCLTLPPRRSSLALCLKTAWPHLGLSDSWDCHPPTVPGGFGVLN